VFSAINRHHSDQEPAANVTAETLA